MAGHAQLKSSRARTSSSLIFFFFFFLFMPIKFSGECDEMHPIKRSNVDKITEPRQANLRLRAFRHDKF